MKYCTNCGSQLSDTDKFCSKCGQSTSQSSNDSVKADIKVGLVNTNTGRPPAPVKKTPSPGRYITKIEGSNTSNLSPPQKWNYNCVGCNQKKIAVKCYNCKNRYLIDNGSYLVCERCETLNSDFLHTCEHNPYFEKFKSTHTNFYKNRDRFFSRGNNKGGIKGGNKGGRIILIVLIVLIFAIFSFATRNT